MTTLALPRRQRGRPTAAKATDHVAGLQAFADVILQIQSRLDFRVSSRGWCYLLEQAGMITKGEFDNVQTIINDCRKSGLLPLDICLEDSKRAFAGVEDVDGRDLDVHARTLLSSLDAWISEYVPFSFWEDKPVYIQMLVEKLDLRPLFEPVCARYHVPIANVGGWADLNVRAELMRRFKEHEAAGRQCVLLYCGDHDPGGLQISEQLRSNLAEMAGAVAWEPDNLVIDRFGLNYDFIVANNLIWIDNLETGSGKRLDDPRHKDHGKLYVQNYLKQFGARKVEANALVVRVEQARQLCDDAIQRWLQDPDAPERYAQQIEPYRRNLVTAVSDAWGDW